MAKDTSGIDKARETANKIKNRTKDEKENKELEKSVEKSLVGVEVQGVTVDSDVADFYKKNADVGSDNIFRTSLPSLKVTESNSKNELADGSRSNIGYLFYTASKEEFDLVEVSIMSVSKGYYSKGINDGDDPKFNQIVSGMILDGMKPFIMYVSGKRLQNLWDFGKELSPFTKDKESPVPMLGFKINLSTSPVKHKYGTTHIVDFKIVRDEDKHIQLITDIEVLKVLRSGIDSMEQAVESMIEATEIDKQTGELLKDSYQDGPITDDEFREATAIDENDMPF